MGIVLAPVSGTVLPLEQVPDPVFSSGMLGQGWAIDPFPGGLTVLSPAEGEILALHPHACVIAVAPDVHVLMHLGIDTVSLHGDGFTSMVKQGDHVKAGQPFCLWNTSLAAARGLSLLSPQLVIGATQLTLAPELASRVDCGESARVEAGKSLCIFEF